ncbi:hypothetical protein J8I26_02845 [Herbaspirillum sp. LeCh32-8]|uniref:T6SS immunity protein Tli3 family protein n=1 Tax=Herbaspirillum sp. LeCh32-8 TaxID=2821356 RepID=UPI001AEA43F3|nr:hypothetical protein [Herbaspirillum sp. LeCh32-8]MBP0597023.1 hypothetical protein [Herbaspirillum sp. LeCh32-8]
MNNTTMSYTSWRQKTGMVGTILLAIGLAGCASQGDMTPDLANMNILRPSPDLPPQVVYRIDDHRYVSLENYDSCYGDHYYVDTRLGLHTKIWTDNLSEYRGRLVNADPTGMNIVIPSAPAITCRDKGCNVRLAYSTDAGRSFKYKQYMHSFYPTKDSENYSVLVAQDGFYVVKTHEYAKGKIDNRVTKFPLASGIDLEKPYPNGLHDEYLSNKPLPPLHTPSGQERLSCDATIRPSSLPQAK